MTSNTMTLRSRYDGLDIGVVVVRPEGEPKAVLQLVHGMCGCKERMLPVMEFMAQRGVACVAGDNRGHGTSVRSADDLGYMYDGGYKALVDDLRMITSWSHEEFPGVPLYLLGHSMGSMAARVYVKEDDSAVDGLIVCGSPSWNPMSHIGRTLSWLLCSIGLSRYRTSLIQRLTSARYNRKFSAEGRQAWTCSDPEVRRNFEQRPECNFFMTANGSYCVMSLMFETYRQGVWRVSNPQMPVLFISGEDDPTMISEEKFHQAAQNLCDRGYYNVTSAIYSGMRHEVLNEIGKEDVWDDILGFMNLK